MNSTTKKPSHKLDIFKTLGRISQKDRNYYDSLSDEEKKGFLPLIVMRWLSGTSNQRQVYFLNEFVNTQVFSNWKHPKLLYSLMTICTTGKGQRYHWNKAQSKKTTSTPTTISVIRDYFGYNTIQAIEALPMLSNDTILAYAEELGRQKDAVSKLKKELKGR